MRKKYVLCGVITMLLFSLTGCVEAYELSEADQTKVANYAAHVVAKYNRRQEKGLEPITQADIDKSLEKEEKKKQQEDSQDAQNSSNANSSEGSSVQNENAEAVTLAQALQMETGLDAAFVNYDITEKFVQEDYFLLNATAGKQYLVLHVDLTAGAEAVACDMYAKDLSYQIVINGDKKVVAQTSILLNDLGTYQGTIEAGGKASCVLLFETEAENLQNIEHLQLYVTSSAGKSVVNLK